jgi:hypothetical protein
LFLIDFEFAKEYKPGEVEVEVYGTKSYIPVNLKVPYDPWEKEKFAVQKTIESFVALAAE